MQGKGFAGAAFVFIEGMEAAQVGIVKAGPEVVLGEVGVPPFSSVEVESGTIANSRCGIAEEIAVGVVGEGVRYIAFQVGEGSDMSTLVFPEEDGCQKRELQG